MDKKIGNLLLEAGVVNREQLQAATGRHQVARLEVLAQHARRDPALHRADPGVQGHAQCDHGSIQRGGIAAAGSRKWATVSRR